MSGRLPLPTLLSRVLVAFTVEFDNEAEHQLPHRTSNYGATGGASRLAVPWLVSAVMWMNCMRFLDDKGLTARDLGNLARTKTNLNGMERWGYVTVRPDENDRRPKPPRSSWLIRPTPAGKRAQAIWQPLFAMIEQRWKQRFGEVEMKRLRESLGGIVRQMDLELPDCLPILGDGLWSGVEKRIGREDASGLSLLAAAVVVARKALRVSILDYNMGTGHPGLGKDAGGQCCLARRPVVAGQA